MATETLSTNILSYIRTYVRTQRETLGIMIHYYCLLFVCTPSKYLHQAFVEEAATMSVLLSALELAYISKSEISSATARREN